MRTNRLSWLMAAKTVSPLKAKSSIGPSRVATVRMWLGASMRSSVPAPMLDTQTTPLWTFSPFAPKPLTGASAGPVAHAFGAAPHSGTRQTVDCTESAMKTGFAIRPVPCR